MLKVALLGVVQGITEFLPISSSGHLAIAEALLGIDILFHLASSSVPSTSNIDTVSDVNKNLIPTLNILNLAIKLGLKRIVYFFI